MNINFEQIEKEAVNILSELIKINTTNPPGQEIEAAKFIGEILKKEKIDFEIISSKEKRGNLIAQYGEGKESLLLMAHLDVVPAEEEKWSVSPFSGEVKDGFIWGRGAIDCKSLVVEELMSLLLLKRNNIALNKKIILCFCADEEKGGKEGIEYLVNNHFDKIKAEYCLNEGGGLGITFKDKIFYLCQTAEKGICWLKIKTTGTPGHGSLPVDNNAVVNLSRIIHKISNFSPPFKKTPSTKKMIEEISKNLSFPQSFLLKYIVNPLFFNFILKNIKEKGISALIYALFHNTVVPTMLKAGKKTNVIPSEAEAEVDCRILPGVEPEKFVEEIKNFLEEENIEIEITDSFVATESSYDNQFYKTICEVISEDKGAKVIPFMLTGATDSRFLRKKDITSYGFAPFRADIPLEEYFKMVHGIDERISIENLIWGTKVLFEIVRRFCG